MSPRTGDTRPGGRARGSHIPAKLISEAVTAQASRIRDIAAFIHAHPELAFEEHQCAGYLATVLQQAGLHVERGVGGMATAFKATVAGAHSGRKLGLVAVYDAVPTVVPDGTMAAIHSCGHGRQAAGVAGAALALADLADQLAGSVVVLGLPADETMAPAASARGGGKEISVKEGLWEGLDVALYAHPEFVDAVLLASLWMRQDQAITIGRRSLVDQSAQDTLEAVRAALRRVRAATSQRLILERAQFRGNVEEGCQLTLDFRLFAGDESGLVNLAHHLRAELPEAIWRERRIVPSIRSDDSVRTAVASAMAEAGRACAAAPPALPHATDFGYISRAMPAALIGLGRDGGWAMHAEEGAAQFAGAEGEAVGLAIAQVLAFACSRLSEEA